MLPDRNQRMGIAIHEAAHAVAALSRGMRVERVGIGPACQGENSVGECQLAEGGSDFDEVVYILAGFAGQRKYDPVANPCVAGSDRVQIRAKLSQRYGRKVEHLDHPMVEAAQREAEAIVENRWFEIQQLAAALMMRIEIKGEELREIVAKAATERITKEIERLEKSI